MSGSYIHLELAERALIETQLSLGLSPAAIAAGLRLARSTIMRDLLARPRVIRPHDVPQLHRVHRGASLSTSLNLAPALPACGVRHPRKHHLPRRRQL